MAPRPKITPISPPTPPQPPAAPRPPSSPVADPTELARNLAQMLHDGKRDLVLQKVDDLAPAGRDVLERAMIGALSKDKNKDQAIELRRIIRFSRHRPTPPPNGGDFSAEKGNTIKWKIGNKERDKVDVDTGGTVTFRTNAIVDAGSAGKSKEAYWLTYQGPEAADMRWLQFFWRMVVAEFPLKGGKTRTTPVKMRLDNKGGVPYHLTTDEKKPQWTVDSTKKDRPFYDEAAKRSSFTIEMIDFPSAMPTNAMAADYFTRLTSPTGEKLTSAPKNVVAHFYAKTYLIHGMDVLYRADIHLKWTFTSPTTPAVEVALAQGVPTKELESAHRACLALQYPDVDYLPGRPIEAPQPMDDFDPVPDLAPMNWDNKTKTDLERYADIAALAHAEWINDVNPLTMSKDFIPRRVTDVTPGAVGMDPGLNYSAHFPEPGQTGYIDANKVYHNPDFPGDRDGPLPKIAIKLGETAFKLGKVRDKAFALGTMRHEMKHAAHEQLAIGWLLKWRDELTETPFKNWLEGERKKKHITELDFALVSMGLGGPLAATEVLAWTEGFVTALQFLPAKPEFKKHMLTQGDWPGAITELEGAGRFFNQLSSQAVKDAALNRIREVICSTVTQQQRDALIEWLHFLQNPEFPKNPTPDEQKAISLFNSSFPPLKNFLREVIANVEKPCPK